MRYFHVILTIILIGLSSCKSSRTAVSGGSGRLPDAGSVTDEYSEALVKTARSWIGTPYRYGGHSKKGTDCSGFLMEVYRDAVGIKLPRSSRDQHDFCTKVGKDKLIVGDLLFFSSRSSKGKVSHVGMYIGNNEMIHASSSRGVIVSNIDEKYYVTHYRNSGRVQEFADLVKSADKKKDRKADERERNKDKKSDKASKKKDRQSETALSTGSRPSPVPKTKLTISLDDLTSPVEDKKPVEVVDSVYSSWMD